MEDLQDGRNHLNACMADVGRRMSFPFSVGDVHESTSAPVRAAQHFGAL